MDNGYVNQIGAFREKTTNLESSPTNYFNNRCYADQDFLLFSVDNHDQ